MLSWEMIEDWLKTKSEESFKEIYSEAAPIIRRCCKRMVFNAADIEDVCQDAFVLFLKRLTDRAAAPDWKNQTVELFIFYRVRDARKRWWRQKCAKKRGDETNWTAVGGSQELPIEEVAQSRDQAMTLVLLSDAIGSLDQPQREIVERRLQNYTFKEISELRDEPLSVVYSSYQRSIAQLRKIYVEKFDGEAPCSS